MSTLSPFVTGPETDEAIELFLGRVLQAGVTIAAVVAAIGAAYFYTRHAWQPATYHTFTGQPQQLRTLRGVAHGILTFRGRAIIQAGMLLLIATPITRVALSLLAFARQRDWLYVTITSVVFALLLASFFVEPN